METPKKYENMRKELEIISEKTRYKILLTLLASEKSLSLSRLKELLTSIAENNLNYHLKILKENDLIKNEKRMEYKRSEPRSFYSLSKKSMTLLANLGLAAVKEEFQALFKQMT
ncbi:MAG: winged helix-turn-helix domain-containing protein [Promethearchaeota archaeon]